MRTGAPWRDLPEEFGNWNSIFRQFRRWADSGIWDVILEALAGSGVCDATLQMIDATIIRAHLCAAGARAQRARSFARRLLDQNQRPYQRRGSADRRRDYAPGKRTMSPPFPALMQEIDCDPEQMLDDKGYDSEAVRRDIAQRGGKAAIPGTATRKIQHVVDKALYALRNRIERFFNRAKNSRRLAARYDKLIESFAAFVLLACIRIWVKVCPHDLMNGSLESISENALANTTPKWTCNVLELSMGRLNVVKWNPEYVFSNKLPASN
jgi:transposase